ncbi:hypothetical protein C8R43DRAFT_1090555 [Mycena crocata]|nr:hypothetical protein C8R43DRAFT_1090555 [Mycena crocata]
MDSPLNFATTVRYIELIGLLKPALRWNQASYQTHPPDTLPVNVHDFLKLSLGLTDDITKRAWERLRQAAWEDLSPAESLAARTKYITLFLQHGLSRGIGIYSLEPPTRTCVDAGCAQALRADPTAVRDSELTLPITVKITVHTKEFGSVPGFSTSRYCRHCKTRYHPNYFVHSNATLRTYYQEGLQFLQISGHIYIDIDLCELFSTMMVTSWYVLCLLPCVFTLTLYCRTSATNCARTYNDGLANQTVTSFLPAMWPYNFELDVEDVWNAFFLHNLILDHNARHLPLQLLHSAASQSERFRPALHERNARLAGTGQEAWNHACDVCCWFHMRDGVLSFGPSSPTESRLAALVVLFKTCVVTDCKRDADKGFRTCSLPDHRALESYHYLQGKAMFQLKHRLERLNVSQTHDSLSAGHSRPLHIRMSDELDGDLLPDLIDPTDGDDEELEGLGAAEDEDVEIDANGICDGKPETGNRSVRARFGRRRTHNEELCVASCGVILGRATFYGSEAPNGVRTFWMKLFPTKRSLPQNDPDEYLRTYFDSCALPVDVFHFKCKHKESDIECGLNCNPYSWPELRTEDGKWRFNSSAAEQTNAWFGGFQSMVREMSAERYDFFLDEMVLRRNRGIIKNLKQRGQAPHSIPREELLGEDGSPAS